MMSTLCLRARMLKDDRHVDRESDNKIDRVDRSIVDKLKRRDQQKNDLQIDFSVIK